MLTSSLLRDDGDVVDKERELKLECETLIAQMDHIMSKWRREDEEDEYESKVRELLMLKTCRFSKWIIGDVRKIDEYETLTCNEKFKHSPVTVSQCGHGEDGIDIYRRCYETKTSEINLKPPSFSSSSTRKKTIKNPRCNFSWPIPKTRAELLVSIFEKTGNKSLFDDDDDDDDDDEKTLYKIKNDRMVTRSQCRTVEEKAMALVRLFVLSPPNITQNPHNTIFDCKSKSIITTMRTKSNQEDFDYCGQTMYTIRAKKTGKTISTFHYSCGFLMRYFFFLSFGNKINNNNNANNIDMLNALVASASSIKKITGDDDDDDDDDIIKKYLSEEITTNLYNFGCEQCRQCGQFHRLEMLQSFDQSYRFFDKIMPASLFYENLYKNIPSQCKK
jgi:hypothetical protein